MSCWCQAACGPRRAGKVFPHLICQLANIRMHIAHLLHRILCSTILPLAQRRVAEQCRFLKQQNTSCTQYLDNFNSTRTTEQCSHGLESQSHDTSESMRIVTRLYRSLGCTFTRPFPPQVAFTRLISNFCSGDLTPCESFLQVATRTSSYTSSLKIII